MAAEGTDFGGVLDIDRAWRTVGPRRALAEAIGRRLTTPNGALPDWPDYGFDLTSLVGTTIADSAIRQQVQAQCLAEEEVLSAAVTVTRVGESLSVSVVIEDGVGPFELTINVSGLEPSVIIPPGL